MVGIASPSTISGLLNRFPDNGYVNWEEGRPRTLRIIKTVS